MLKYLLVCLCGVSLAFAEDAPKEKEIDVSKISEAFGHLIGKNIETLGLHLDMNQVIKGLKEAIDGKNSPMTEAECVEAISKAQEKVFQKQAADNLAKAEQFLSKNAKEKGVVVVEEGKLQYKIEKQGNGEEIQEHFSPLIKYTGTFADGSVFGASKEDQVISLDETIPGFTRGLLGMKEGEKRILYIHPDYGYGTSGYLPPNSLLTFEVELVKANAPEAEEQTAQPSPEIAETIR